MIYNWLKFTLSIALISISISAKAGFIIGGFAGRANDNGDGIEKLQGSVAGMKVGWRWNWLALEYAKSKFDMRTEKGQSEDFYIQKAELKGTSSDILLRFYPIRFLSIAGGVSSLDLDGDILLTNVNGNPGDTISSSGSTYDSGTVIAAALHIPIGKGFELYGEFMQRKWSSMSSDLGITKTPDLILNEWHAGLVWQWGGGSSRAQKSKKSD